ncbi:MAG: iron ABC transporter permease [Deltaproteobacteria bacterium]|nr:iron ABC transporter permease [Deltaproteobacteria bacterium]
MSLSLKKITASFVVLLLVALCAVLFLPLAGVPVLSPHEIVTGHQSMDRYIYFHLRLPELVLAFLTGAALSVSGVSFQALLKNPLADPYILGISGGAALGYVLAVVAGLPFILVPITGYAFALISLVIIYKLACHRGVLSVTSLLLIGIVFNAFSFALILVVNALANFGQAQQILYLLLGSIDPVGWQKILILTLLILISFLVLFFKARVINILSLGDEEAFHLGVKVNREKKIIFVVTSLLVGASVSLCGLIGFIGLIVPHMTRIVFGADNRVVIPASALAGGTLLVLCHFVAGHVISFETLNTRLPVGAITALIGAPVFVYLLKKHKLLT